MKFSVAAAPHWLGADPVATIMRRVLLALLPVIIASSLLLGPGVLFNVGFALLCCTIFEALCLALTQKSLRVFLGDGSALITAAIIGLAMPALTPWWVNATACLFAIVFAKHLYGGLGQNIFNPAMIGYVVVLVSFPAQLANWPADTVPGWGQSAQFFLWGDTTGIVDALSGATPLDQIKIELAAMLTIPEILAAMGSTLQTWVWINLAALAGGVWLLATRVIRWHLPVSMLGTMAALYLTFYLVEPGLHPPPVTGLMTGGTMLAAFFVITDPVSAPASDGGRLLFGAGCGALSFVLRQWGAFPDGLAFAVIFMNMLVPLIDRYTVPRIYGHKEH